MLSAASNSVLPGAESTRSPREPIDVDLARHLAVIERSAGASNSVARSTALSILAQRDTALEGQIEVEPPAMAGATFQAHLAAVMRQLETVRDSASVQTAA
jgi:intracellular multiplication protein IcmO